MTESAPNPIAPNRRWLLPVMPLAAIFAMLMQTGYAQPPARTFLNLEYARAGTKSLLLDLYVPPGSTTGQGPYPVVIWIHGGAWLEGNKGNGGPARRLTARGYAIASINYRLSYEATFPAQIEDCKAAVRWLRANAAQYNLDPSRIAAWGSSAGGHLAALLGATGDVPELEGGLNFLHSSRVQAVIDWYGPADLLRMEEQDLPCSLINHNSPLSPESLLVGCAIQSCPASARAASPVSYVSSDDPPFLIMHGTFDCLVPPLQSQTLFDALRFNGVTAFLQYLGGAGHGGPAFDGLTSQNLVNNFLDTYLLTTLPTITGARVSGKKLYVYGVNFAHGARLLLNGEAQGKTSNDPFSPANTLVAKKSGKKIAAGQTVTLQVGNPDGTLSSEFRFVRP